MPGPGTALGLTALGLGGTWGAAALQGRAALLDELLPVLVVLAWIAPAWWIAQAAGRDPLRVHAALGRPRGLAGAAGVSLLLLAAYAGAWLAVWGAPPQAPAVQGLLGLAVYQLAFVALPEEYFFRGVLQPAWEARWPRGPTVLGGRLGPAALGAAALFGVCHLVRPGVGFSPAGLLTVFPGIWFAWLRARTGSIWPGVVCHALANVLEAALRGATG